MTRIPRNGPPAGSWCRLDIPLLDSRSRPVVTVCSARAVRSPANRSYSPKPPPSGGS